MKQQEMWEKFSKENNINAEYEAWSFCGGGKMGDELAELVISGVKTATASSHICYEVENEPLPKVGGYSVILYDNQEAACIIKTTKITLKPFDEVDAEHAYKEGEGDRSLEFWREVHQRAFTPDYALANLPFDEKGIIVLEEFEVVYK